MAFGFGFALTAIAKAVGFTPRSLFASGAQGAWYDPSDYTTLFEDSAGTIPITTPLEKPVGLMLDKSKGLVLGSELVTNGDFSNGTTGWAAGSSTISVVGGQLQVQNSGATYGYAYQRVDVVIGKTYKVTVTITNVSTQGYINLGSSLGNGSINQTAGPGTINLYFTATSTNCYIQLLNINANNGIALYDNISVKELPGNHAYQTTTTSRPTLSARYNLLTKTEQFDDAVWSKVSTTVATNAAVAPNGTTTANKLIETTASNAYHQAAQAAGGSGGLSAKASCYIKAAERSNASVLLTDGGGTNFVFASFDLANGTAGAIQYAGSGFSAGVASITHVGSNWYLCSVTGSRSGVFTPQCYVEINNGTTRQYTGDGTSGIYIWGADLRVANDGIGLPAYQRVNTATDYDYAGFPPYLKFDGTDDWMATGSIDFTATDKMFVAAGVRKLSDAAAAGMVLETSTQWNLNAGAFGLQAPEYIPQQKYIGFVSGGSTNTGTGAFTTSSSFSAPVTFVGTGISDIAAPIQTLRLNGSQAATAITSQGTGKYGNYPLYIGRRGGTSYPFNGRLYSLVVCGKTASASEITSTESYINNKTKAY